MGQSCPPSSTLHHPCSFLLLPLSSLFPPPPPLSLTAHSFPLIKTAGYTRIISCLFYQIVHSNLLNWNSWIIACLLCVCVCVCTCVCMCVLGNMTLRERDIFSWHVSHSCHLFFPSLSVSHLLACHLPRVTLITCSHFHVTHLLSFSFFPSITFARL